MSVNSAGILLFRFRGDCIEVLLVHPGGPFWTNKDEGAWSIPKGIYGEHESPLDAAKRELFEETGFRLTGRDSSYFDLGVIRQPSRKMLHTWAVYCSRDCEGYDFNHAAEISNKFVMEWPKKSGDLREFPEIDRSLWFDLSTAEKKICWGQAGFLLRLERLMQFPGFTA